MDLLGGLTGLSLMYQSVVTKVIENVIEFRIILPRLKP